MAVFLAGLVAVAAMRSITDGVRSGDR
jgi:hypothetical protein